jgi:hypothetical protein
MFLHEGLLSTFLSFVREVFFWFAMGRLLDGNHYSIYLGIGCSTLLIDFRI